MSVSLHVALSSVVHQMLPALSNVLGKAAAHAEARKIDQSVLLNARLYPDMLPLSRQIQIVSDSVKGAAARLAGVENPSYADTETTFAELQERLAKTLAFFDSIPAEAINNATAKEINFKAGPAELSFHGTHYVLNWVFPNMYFHVATAYDILRHNGVEIGKRDYLGRA